MKICISLSASFPATQFGGIVFLAIDLAKEISEMGHDVTIYTTDLDFSNGANKFNKQLPRIEKFKNLLLTEHMFGFIKIIFYKYCNV